MATDKMPRNDALETRFQSLEERIRTACSACGRDRSEIRLLAVSKTRSAEDVRTLADAGLNAFGENYVDEAEAKIDSIVYGLFDLTPDEIALLESVV